VEFKALKENENDERLVMTITDGREQMFELRLSYAYLENHRQKVGIQGNWEAYFGLFKSALKCVEVNNEPEGGMSLDFYYPMYFQAYIKGTFKIGQE
jgi:hypothetical protein